MRRRCVKFSSLEVDDSDKVTKCVARVFSVGVLISFILHSVCYQLRQHGVDGCAAHACNPYAHSITQIELHVVLELEPKFTCVAMTLTEDCDTVSTSYVDQTTHSSALDHAIGTIKLILFIAMPFFPFSTRN